MRIVITGASGNIGTALLRRLARDDQQHEVVGVVRWPPPSEPPYDRVMWHAVDLTAPTATATLATLCTGADAVVHLAWGFQFTRDEPYLQRLGVGGTRSVLHAAEAAGVAHLVHMSSVGVYSPSRDDRRVEESYPRQGVPTSAYSRHKARAEQFLDEYEHTQPGGGMSITRLRPGFVLQRDAASAMMRYGLPGWVPAQAVRWLPLLPLDRSLTIPVIHTDDLADAVVRVLHRRVHGAFNLAGEPPLTRADIADALGAHPVHVPAGMLRAVVDLTWRARLQALSPGWVDLAFAVPLLDTGRARSELNWQPKIDARDALRELLTGMRDAAGTTSPVLRPRSVSAQLRDALTTGSMGHRRRP